MRKSILALVGLAAGAGAAALIYRNWRHIVRHPLKLSPATYAIGVERNIPIEVERGLMLAADHYYPKVEGRFPTILIRSPYDRATRRNSNSLHQVIDLWATAYHFKRGHRLRLIVSSGAHPR